MTIRTSHWLKPIPMRSCDWEAVTNDYEPGHPIGHGRTEADAVADLNMQLEAIAYERSAGQCECEGGCLSVHGQRCENKDGARGYSSVWKVALKLVNEKLYCQRCTQRRADMPAGSL